MKTFVRGARLLKVVWLGIGLGAWLLLGSGCGKANVETTPAVVARPASARLAVTGMHCDGCAQHITEVVSGKPGVISCKLTFESKVAEIEYDASEIGTDGLIAAVVEAGYKAEVAPPATADAAPVAAPPAATETAAP